MNCDIMLKLYLKAECRKQHNGLIIFADKQMKVTVSFGEDEMHIKYR